MKTARLCLLFFVLFGSGAGLRAVDASVTFEQRLTRLEKETSQAKAWAGASFLAGVICALWAQNTARNPWIWFFFGFVLSAFALLALLYYNAQDIARRRPSSPPG